MKERPILFSAPMVRAILKGRKTQTRRVVKLNAAGRIARGGKQWHIEDAAAALGCPYGQPGDRLWVRETFVQGYDVHPLTGCLIRYDEAGDELPMKTWYRATDRIHWSDDDGWESHVPWKPSIHMPRAASRITLEVTGVRVERLKAISDDDAIAEGAEEAKPTDDRYRFERPHFVGFYTLWESINGAGSWDANPWVWVVEFRRLEQEAKAT